MTTQHDAPRWVYLGGKMVQAKPDAPDHDSSPLYVLARDHAALAERCRAMEEALQFYADVSKYPAPLTGGAGDLYFDCGQVARAALARGGRG